MANPDELTDLSDLNKDTPVKQNDTRSSDEEALRRRHHLEQEAMKAAKRAGERENRDELGNDEFKNIGPV